MVAEHCSENANLEIARSDCLVHGGTDEESDGVDEGSRRSMAVGVVGILLAWASLNHYVSDCTSLWFKTHLL